MARKLELAPLSYALKLNAEEATELHYGVAVEGSTNICLCGVCLRQIEEHEEMWYVSEINEVLCEECFKEYLSYKYPHILHNKVT